MTKNAVAKADWSLNDYGGNVWGSRAVAANAWSYVGVFYPTQPLPAAIMPTIPTAANTRQGWEGYDPCTIEKPVFADGAQQYYVDAVNGNDGTAGNSGRGSVALPRQTIPGLSWGGNGVFTLTAGDQIFLVGDGAVYDNGGTPDNLDSITLPGTSTDPIWIIGVYNTTRPRFSTTRAEFGGNCSHVIFDDVHIGGTNSHRWTAVDGARYLTWRNCLVAGDPTNVESTASRRLLNFVGSDAANTVEFVMIYNCTIRDIGKWDVTTPATDCLGVHIQEWSRYVWVIDCQIYHIQGDSVMFGNSNYWDLDHARRPHYCWVAGCEMYENYENACDAKDSFHCFFTQNDVHDFYTLGTAPAANATAIISGQDSEGYLSGYRWFFNNDIYNCGIGIRDVSTSDESYVYHIGNHIRDFDDIGISINARDHNRTGGEHTAAEYSGTILNTFETTVSGSEAIMNPQGGNTTVDPVLIEVNGNLIIGGDAAYDLRLEDHSGTDQICSNNIVYRATGGVINVPGDATTANNTTDTDPNIDANGVPQTGSVAFNYIPTIHSSFALFETLYGLSIKFDKNGNAIPNTNLTCGAYQS